MHAPAHGNWVTGKILVVRDARSQSTVRLRPPANPSRNNLNPLSCVSSFDSMFSSGSPLNPSFWTGDKDGKDKDGNGKIKSKKKADIDLKRLSVFNVDSAATTASNRSPVRTKSSDSQKENSLPENKGGSATTESEQEMMISNLMAEMKKKDAQIVELTEEVSNPSIQRRNHRLSQLKTHIIHDNGRLNGLKGVKLARSGSIMTTNVLEAMSDPTKSGVQVIAESLIKVFQKPKDHIGNVPHHFSIYI